MKDQLLNSFENIVENRKHCSLCTISPFATIYQRYQLQRRQKVFYKWENIKWHYIYCNPVMVKLKGSREKNFNHKKATSIKKLMKDLKG